MPRKRWRTKLAHRELTWNDCDISDQLDFFAGWRPGSRSRWATWEEYLSAWAAVREEGLAAWEVTRAEQLAAARGNVTQRQAEVWSVEDAWRDLHDRLLAEAEESLAEIELEALPFAEVVYQRVLAGGAPEGDDGDD
jgi:hypothetical protein